MTSDVAWARTAPAIAARELLLSAAFRPLIALYTRRTVRGLEHLEGLRGPVLFVANHASHMDTPLLLRALPWGWRRRTAVAAAADYFYGSAVLAHAVSLAFNTVPVERHEAGAAGASELETLLDRGWSLVVFAEGTRSRDGTVGRLRAGAAVLAAQRGLPIVPVHVSGTHDVMPVGRGWMRRGAGRRRTDVRVAFGPAIRPEPSEHRSEVMEQVREFLASDGAETTPDKRVERLRDRSPA